MSRQKNNIGKKQGKNIGLIFFLDIRQQPHTAAHNALCFFTDLFFRPWLTCPFCLASCLLAAALYQGTRMKTKVKLGHWPTFGFLLLALFLISLSLRNIHSVFLPKKSCLLSHECYKFSQN